MGYTHYWSFNKPERIKGAMDLADAKYKAALLECQVVLKKYQFTAEGLDRLSGYSVNTPNGKYGGLELNGKQEMQHEPFIMREHFRDALKEQRGFCKTARKPYDDAVAACLCILKYHLGDLISVGSDGDTEDWIAGSKLSGRPIPASIPRSKIRLAK